MAKGKAIAIKCETGISVSWADLRDYEANDLKIGTERNLVKMKNAIVNEGFRFPFYVWQDHYYIIDGAGRIEALKQLEGEGFKLPDAFPVVNIPAETMAEAKKCVLMASSRFGDPNQDSFAAFAEGLDIGSMMDEIVFPGIDLTGFTPDPNAQGSGTGDEGAGDGSAGGDGDGGNGGSGGGYTIQYNIVFDNEAQQQVWFDFLKALKEQNSDPESTIAERVVQYIDSQRPWN